MGIDTGSEILVMSKHEFESRFAKRKLSQLINSTKTTLCLQKNAMEIQQAVVHHKRG
jgi:hypothetical protein